MLTPLASMLLFGILRDCWSIHLRGRIGLVEKISDWEPAARPVPDTTLDGRLREGNTYLEHSAPGVSLDSGLMEGMSCLEPLEQSILHSPLVARPSICVMEERVEAGDKSSS